MRGAVSPLRVTLILTVPHLHLKRAGIRSLSSRTGNTSTYIPASSTLLILLWCLRFSRYIYTMICVAALCRTSSSPLLKLNTAMTYKIGTKALSAILDAMKLIRSPPVDSCSEYHPNDYWGSPGLGGVRVARLYLQPDSWTMKIQDWRLRPVSGWDFPWRGRQAWRYGYSHLLPL